MISGYLSRLPIRTKLVVMIMLTSTTVLVLASAGFVVWDYLRLRAQLETELRGQARLVLDNSAAALSFRDARAANETLSTLTALPRLRTACLYDQKGNLFSWWHRDKDRAACPPSPAEDGVRFRTAALEVTTSGMLGSTKFGTVFLSSSADVLTARLRVESIVSTAVLLVALGVALVLSSRLQRLVSVPILGLARTAADVSSKGDYSLRASKVTDDELGELVDAVNRMLQQIQRRESELREANRLKDEFLATLSHELRTPLNAIVGWTALLKKRAVPPDQVDQALEKIERNAQAQARLVEDLLEVSRITTGKLRVHLAPFDMAAVVRAAVESARPLADARHVAIDCHGLALALPSVGDSGRLQQVVYNLVSNAVKFTGAGGTVAVTLTRSGGFDTLTVRDTGIGIDPEFLGSVFDPFRQADASSTREQGGLGLGLSIARSLVELHGGAIAAVSAGIGRGSTFTVRLPVHADSHTLTAGVDQPISR